MRARHLKAALLIWLTLGATSVWADTVYLQNGASIDGVVVGERDGVVIVSIGNLGRVTLAAEEVKSIERNSKTGYIQAEGQGTGGSGAADPEETAPPQPSAEPAPAPAEGAAPTEPAASGDPAGTAEVTKELAPERKKEIEEWIHLLTRTDARKRTRGERFLLGAGEDALDLLLPIATDPSEWTRAAVYRIFKQNGDVRVVDTVLLGLADDNQWVRKLAWETLARISGKPWTYAWQDSATERQRIESRKRWISWWGTEKERLEKERLEKQASGAGATATAGQTPGSAAADPAGSEDTYGEQ